jgi:pimeloyl-ACP methyl ester carboxylesterase
VPGQHALVNGTRLYYEMHGLKNAGPPMVLLHGGIGGIEMFGPNLPVLAGRRRVIAVDLPGHARSDDGGRALRYETMADDIFGLLQQLDIGQADVIGYSLGGGVALQMAIRHPEVVHKLVIVSSVVRRGAFYPEILAAFDCMGAADAAMMKHSPLGSLYPNKDWERLFTKVGDLQRQDFDWSNDVATIRVATLLIFADADTYHPEDIVAFYKLLGGGQRDAGWDAAQRTQNQLAILPGMTHYNLLTTTAVAELVERFLDG